MRTIDTIYASKYNPLCGGWLTGRFKTMNDQAEAGSRFDSNRADMQATNYRYGGWLAVTICKANCNIVGLGIGRKTISGRWGLSIKLQRLPA